MLERDSPATLVLEDPELQKAVLYIRSKVALIGNERSDT